MGKTKNALLKTAKNFLRFFPILIGMLLLISLISTVLPANFYVSLFMQNKLTDPLIGATLGSIIFGNPMTSYIIGGELYLQGVSLVAVTSFILSWVTVGVMQAPAEILMLGKKFTIARNLLAFLSSIIVSILVVLTISLI